MTPEYTLGLVFVGLVALIWSASSILVQSIYDSEETQFDSPFVVTYIGVSLFTLWLLPDLFQYCMMVRGSGGLQQSPSSSSSSPTSTAGPVYRHIPPTDDDGNNETNNHHHNDISDADSFTSNRQHSSYWTHHQHMYAAAWIAPVWFLANWTYNASLLYTSITSSTVLSSTGSLFTFLFALVTADERYSPWKLAGVGLGVGGSIVTALQDSRRRRRWLLLATATRLSLWGDVLGLVSAIGYGAYAVQTRLFCPKDESLYSMKRLLGYIGLFNMVGLAPVTVYLVYGGSSGRMGWTVFTMLVFKGLFDNVLSDYLWLRSVMLTNATVATVGLGLTIPLAFLSDVVLKRSNVLSVKQLLGAIGVLSGFVMVNIGEQSCHNEAPVVPDEPNQEMVVETTSVDEYQASSSD